MIVKLIMSNTVRSSAKERQVSGYRVEPWFAHMVCAPPFILFFCTIKQDKSLTPTEMKHTMQFTANIHLYCEML